jgi:diadenosine tetraphosphate (Ap4A) HIT family hydrolase
MKPTITPTMEKFGHPATLIGETIWWAAEFRRKQITLGALVLAAKCDVAAFSALPAEAFADLKNAVARVEAALGSFSAYERINYLMLMMVDPHPHFHVIPRYAAPRRFAGLEFSDHGWPGPPALDRVVDLPKAAEDRAIADLRALWASAGA